MRSIRWRIAVVAMAISAVVFLGVSILMTSVLRWQLAENLDEGIAQRADTIETVLAEPSSRDLPGDEDLLVQVVDPNRDVVGASANVAGLAPIVEVRPGFRTISDVPGRPETFRVLVREIGSDGGPERWLIVAVNNDDVIEPVRILTGLLALTVPALIGVLGLLTWWLTGRTLRPVERMRSELAEITGTDLGRRVAEPATGDEISRLARTMNETLDRLDQAIHRQRRFVADASHELRSPLTRIRSELEVDLASGRPHDPAATERSVLEETIGLQRLVEDLLDLARADGGIAESVFEPVDLDDIVLREARRLRERGRIEVDLRDLGAALVVGDARQLASAVRNLLDNAERHATSIVTVGLSEAGGRVELSVSDDGAGIPAGDRELIFERFARLDEARTRDGGGAGLGLAIVREIVERHGGTVVLAPGIDTRFVVELPAAP